MSPEARAAVATVREERYRIVEVEEEAEDELLMQPPPSASNRPLKINLDLLLYRSRLARMQACQTTDAAQRRELLRTAEAGLRRCLAMDTSDPRTYVVLGKLLVQQKRYDEARKLYADGSSNTGNTNPFIWASWGYLEAVTGNLPRARKLLDAALVVDDSHAAAWHIWGMLEKREGNYLRARDLWTTGTQRCRRAPGSRVPHIYCALAVMAAELGKREEARAWFEEGTRLNGGPTSCAMWHAWAMMEARMGDESAVRYLFKRALQANPRSRYTHLAWGMWERQQGNARAALQLLARGQALNPADPAIYQAWALVEREAGRVDEARRLFKAGLTVDARHVHLWQAWGVMEAALGNHEEARERFQQGVWADPTSRDVVHVFQAWGVLEWRTGNAQLARELWKAALKVDPKNESVWGTWIAMEEDLGRGEAAEELRIRRSEQQWEFVIPSTFTTRPAANSAAAAAAAASVGPLSALASTLSRFFTVRGTDQAAEAVTQRSRSLRELLPADFRTDLTLDDIIAQAAAIQLPVRVDSADEAAAEPTAAAPTAAAAQPAPRLDGAAAAGVAAATAAGGASNGAADGAGRPHSVSSATAGSGRRGEGSDAGGERGGGAGAGAGSRRALPQGAQQATKWTGMKLSRPAPGPNPGLKPKQQQQQQQQQAQRPAPEGAHSDAGGNGA